MLTIPRGTRFAVLAEDDADDQELLTEAMHAIDPLLQLVCITNGRKFISYLENLGDDALPLLIILDYNIPELTGVEILGVLNANKRYSAIPKIIWSTSNSPLYKSLSVEMGVKDYIIKPNDFGTYAVVAKHMLSFVKE